MCNNPRPVYEVVPNVNVRTVVAWLALIAVSLGAAAGLQRLGVPGSALIGPMLVAIIAAVTGLVDLRVPRQLFTAAQAIIGCLIAQTFTPPVVVSIVHDWFAMVLVVGTTIAAAAVAGWLLARFGTLPAETAAWGSAPGGASAMTALSADYGADPRLVAFMQYLRVTIVVLSAGAVARLLLPHGAHVVLARFDHFDPSGWLATLAIAAVGAWAAIRVRVPAGALLGPMVLGALLHGTGLVRIDVPWWALDAAYLTIGLAVGLLYTRATVRYALRALPELLVSTGVLVALCCASAALLVATVHVDALTAYLATTPGGLDSVTAIATGSGADAPLVLAVQALRIFVVILTGPPIARLIARVV
jgi:uncharacterized protein